MIKQCLFSALGMFICFAGCGCSDDDSSSPAPEAKITVSPEQLTFSNETSSLTLTVTSTADWSIISDHDWCQTRPSGGIRDQQTPITVKVQANKEMTARTATLTIKSGKTEKKVAVTQTPAPQVSISATSVSAGAQSCKININVESNTAWSISGGDGWCQADPSKGEAGTTDVTLNIQQNTTDKTRQTVLTLNYEGGSAEVKVSQLSDVINTPDGYTLVWSDEFNDQSLSMPDESVWWYEVWAPGYVNNELQRYVAGKQGDNVTAEQKNGLLRIHAMKVGNEVISARINTRASWKYGYFEARLRLPKGKGTWPAFWMMPKTSGTWPDCGEIDIMEEVGYNPNYTSSSIHCKSYNHMIGTQKTREVLTPGAQDEFHIYALEWTEDYIRTYVDGKLLLSFDNDKKGNNDTWPFNKEFYLKLNLAWGGDWGGAQGVDESCLPATYEIDYVRVFQKR